MRKDAKKVLFDMLQSKDSKSGLFEVFHWTSFSKNVIWGVGSAWSSARVCESNIFWKLCKLKPLPGDFIRTAYQSHILQKSVSYCLIHPPPLLSLSNAFSIKPFLRQSCCTENAVASLLCPRPSVPVISLNLHSIPMKDYFLHDIDVEKGLMTWIIQVHSQ